MVIVTILNTIVVFLAFFARVEKYRFMLAWAFVFLSLILGVRYGYGNDYFPYQYIFYHGYTMTGQVEDVEPGWHFLNTLFRPLGFSFFVFVLTCIMNFMLYNIIRKHVSPDWYWLAVFLYLFNPSYMLVGLSMLRQFCVMLIGLYALEMALQKRLFLFVLLVLFGFLIHKVALLLLPLYFLPYMKFSMARLWLVIPVLIILAYYIISHIYDIIEIISSFFISTGTYYASSYLNKVDIMGEQKLGNKIIFHYFLYLIMLIRNLSYLGRYGQAISFQVVLGIVVIPFSFVSEMAIRASWIYTIGEIVSFPILIKTDNKLFVKYGVAFLLVILILFFEYREFFSSPIYGRSYNEFKTIFSII